MFTDTFLSPSTAIIGLTASDGVFVVSEVAWDLLVRDDCSEEAREEPPIIEMASLLSIVITCEFRVMALDFYSSAFDRADPLRAEQAASSSKSLSPFSPLA